MARNTMFTNSQSWARNFNKWSVQIASDNLPFIERLTEIIQKNYHIPGNPATDEDLD